MDELIPDPALTPPPAALPPGAVYAGFWRRFNAYGIDASILWLVCVFLQFLVLGDTKALGQLGGLFGPIFSGTAGPEMLPMLTDTLMNAFSGGAILGADEDWLLVLSSLCNILFVLGPWQATPGKRWLNCKIVRADGSRLTPKDSVIRHAASGISAYLGMVPCLTVAFTRDKLALHDMIAKTRVIHYP